LQLNQVIRLDWTVLLTSRCVVGRGCSLDKRQENNENAKERPLWKILIGLSTLDNIFFYKLFIHVITLWTICSMDWTFHSQLTTDVSYMLSFGNANVGDLYVNRRVSGKTTFYT